MIDEFLLPNGVAMANGPMIRNRLSLMAFKLGDPRGKNGVVAGEFKEVAVVNSVLGLAAIKAVKGLDAFRQQVAFGRVANMYWDEFGKLSAPKKVEIQRRSIKVPSNKGSNVNAVVANEIVLRLIENKFFTKPAKVELSYVKTLSFIF